MKAQDSIFIKCMKNEINAICIVKYKMKNLTK